MLPKLSDWDIIKIVSDEGEKLIRGTGKMYPLYFDAELRIGASSDPQDILNCYKPDPGYTSQKITDTTINGTVFKKFDFQNAGMEC